MKNSKLYDAVEYILSRAVDPENILNTLTDTEMTKLGLAAYLEFNEMVCNNYSELISEYLSSNIDYYGYYYNDIVDMFEMVYRDMGETKNVD